MSEGITVTIEDIAVQNMLKRMQISVSNLSPIFKRIGILMYQDVMYHFDRQEGSRGKWPPIKYRQGMILQDTGRLRNSLRPFSSSEYAKVTTNVEYAPIHNFGGDVPARFIKPIKKQALHWVSDGQDFFSKGHEVSGFKMPQREFMWVSADAKEKINAAVLNYLKGEATE